MDTPNNTIYQYPKTERQNCYILTILHHNILSSLQESGGHLSNNRLCPSPKDYT
jgi:hypothetical protein